MNGNDVIVTRRYEAPCGTLALGSLGDSLCMCDWLAGRHRDQAERRLRRVLDAEFAEGNSSVLDRAVVQLDEYFAGQRQEFDLPLLFAGTDFQKKVWEALLAIPYGETVSYGEMARRIGMPTAVRVRCQCQRSQSDIHLRALPSCDRQRPFPDRLRRRT